MNKKTIIAIALMFFVVLLFSLVIVYKNKVNNPTKEISKPDSTVGWQTFRNEKYGFSFSYPPNSELINNSKEAKEGSLAIFLNNSNNPFGLWINELSDQPTKNYLNMPKISQKRLNSLDWDILYSDPKTPEGGGTQSVYQLIHNNVRFVVQYNDQTQKGIDQILSTFRFLDNTTITGVVNWKTYTNDKFSFYYPNDYYVLIENNYENFFIAPQGDPHGGPNGSCIPGGIGVYTSGNASYDDGLQSIKANLDNLQIKTIPNGQLFIGRQKPGSCGGILRNTALIQYQAKLIVIEFLGENPKDTIAFHQILSTFKFSKLNREIFSSIQGTDVGSGINEETDKAVLLVENKKTQSAGEAISCFAPTKETTITRGNFILEVDTATLNLGEREFSSGTIYDGKLVKYTITDDLLGDPQDLYSLIALPTYCSCNNVCFQFFYYDFDDKNLTRVHLKNRDGSYLSDNVITADKIEVDENYRLKTSYYDNVTGKDITSGWYYHFETKELWQVK